MLESMKYTAIILSFVLCCGFYTKANNADHTTREKCWESCANGIFGAGEVACANECQKYPLASKPATIEECTHHCENQKYTPLVLVHCLDSCPEQVSSDD